MASLARAPAAIGAESVIGTLLRTVRDRLVGRRVTLRVGEDELTLTLTGVEADLDPLAAAVGQLGDVGVDAEDVEWHDWRFPGLRIDLRNVHVRPGTTPTLLAAPVDLRLTVDSGTVADRVAEGWPSVSAEISGDGVARLRWSRRPDWGHVEVAPRPADAGIRLEPQALVAGNRRFDAPRRAPTVTVPLPPLSEAFRVTAVETSPGALYVSGQLAQWREPLPLGRLEDLLKRVSKTASAPIAVRWR